MTSVKICGLRDPQSVKAAVEHGARFIGFVFYPDSPRSVTPEQAKTLSDSIKGRSQIVGLFVNPTDQDIQHVLTHIPLSIIQLHGDETPERVSEIKKLTHLPIMKAFRISSEEDLKTIPSYDEHTDWYLFDTKVTNASEQPYGGTGHAFDWHILTEKSFSKPWMLAGGLTIHNIRNALSILSPDALDISSGVEVERGVKDPQKIAEFLDFVTKL